jgi:hypothetical protein
MAIQQVEDTLFAYLTQGLSGARFEAFAKSIFANVYQENFVPLGGMHDGGADGMLSSSVQEIEGKSNSYAQFSVTAAGGAKTKVMDTINAVRKSGRDLAQLIYATNHAIPKPDILESQIHTDTGVYLRIRDADRIKHYVNSDQKSNSAFYEFFRADVTALSRAAGQGLATVNAFATDPTVYVFLNHEIKDRFSRAHLNDRVVDALIYWALRDTDPELGVLLSRNEVVAAVADAFPMARSVLVPRIDERLRDLSRRFVRIRALGITGIWADTVCPLNYAEHWRRNQLRAFDCKSSLKRRSCSG